MRRSSPIAFAVVLAAAASIAALDAAPGPAAGLASVSAAGSPELVSGTDASPSEGRGGTRLPVGPLGETGQGETDAGPDPRGPYLQTGTPDSVTIRWRTSSNESSRIEYGPAANDLSSSVTDPSPVKDHEITLTGLSPNTTYYYSYGSTSSVIGGGDASHYFRTAPLPGTRQPMRIWVIGDSGSADGARGTCATPTSRTPAARTPTCG